MMAHPKSQSPMGVQIGGQHYRSLAIQPAEFWARNRLPALEGAVVKYVTRHRSKNGHQDIAKARHFVEMMRWWYFDAPDDQRTPLPADRGQLNFAIRPEDYAEANRLPSEESAVVQLVCLCSAREHVDAALELLDAIAARDYPVSSATPALTDSDAMYLAKVQIEHYVDVLTAAGGMPTQIAHAKYALALVSERWRQ